MDIAKDINEIRFTASLTDASLRDYEAVPYSRDFIISAEKRLNCASPFNPMGFFKHEHMFQPFFGACKSARP